MAASREGKSCPGKAAQAQGRILGDLCFQAQQTAEKAIKAVYQHKGILFHYTHDLEELGKGLENSGVPIPIAVEEAAGLTEYAAETQYPGALEPVTDAEYREAVRIAEAVVAWAENIIEKQND